MGGDETERAWGAHRGLVGMGMATPAAVVVVVVVGGGRGGGSMSTPRVTVHLLDGRVDVLVRNVVPQVHAR